MKTQKEAERAEQQRIKNLVLNYDLQDTTDHDGGPSDLSFSLPARPIHSTYLPRSSFTHTHKRHLQVTGTSERHHNASLHHSVSNHAHRSADKSGTNRGGPRVRKLQLSDVDWYDRRPAIESAISLSSIPSDGTHGSSHPGGRKRGQRRGHRMTG